MLELKRESGIEPSSMFILKWLEKAEETDL
jgi:hypothetical protein